MGWKRAAMALMEWPTRPAIMASDMLEMPLQAKIVRTFWMEVDVISACKVGGDRGGWWSQVV